MCVSLCVCEMSGEIGDHGKMLTTITCTISNLISFCLLPHSDQVVTTTGEHITNHHILQCTLCLLKGQLWGNWKGQNARNNKSISQTCDVFCSLILLYNEILEAVTLVFPLHSHYVSSFSSTTFIFTMTFWIILNT